MFDTLSLHAQRIEKLLGAAFADYDAAQTLHKLPLAAFADYQPYLSIRDAIAFQVANLAPSDYALTKDALNTFMDGRGFNPHERSGIISNFNRCRMLYKAEVNKADVPALFELVRQDAEKLQALNDGKAAAKAGDYSTAVPLLQSAGVDAANIEAAAAKMPTRLKLIKGSSVTPTAVEWLWKGRIPKGKLTVIAGDPGVGKSFLTCDILARLTTGTAFPFDETTRQPMSVLIANAEDGVSDTIVPRLMAAQAAMDRISIIESTIEKGKERCFNLSDVPSLQAAVDADKTIGCVVIDPVGAFIGKIDSHQDSQIRDVLTPLKSFAERNGVSVVCVMHLNKQSKGASRAMYRVMGSLGFVGAARAAFLVTQDAADDERKLLSMMKTNNGKLAPTVAYRLAGDENGTRLEWEPDELELSADDALNGPPIESKLEDASDWLAAYLSDGPKESKMLMGDAQMARYAYATVRRAADKLSVVKTRCGFGPGATWQWRLRNDERLPQDEQPF